MQASPKLSRTKKLDGILSWSTQAATCCLWSGFMDDEVCRYCYAKRGQYQFPPASRVRLHNAQDIFRHGWVQAMVKLLKQRCTVPFFRWFDSGDIRTVREAKLIYSVMKDTPEISHFLPTKSWRSKQIRPVLEAINALPNVRCRYSSVRLNQKCAGKYQSLVYTNFYLVRDVYFCPAYVGTEHKCRGCRACWNHVPIVAFPLHGRLADDRFGPLEKRLPKDLTRPKVVV